MGWIAMTVYYVESLQIPHGRRIIGVRTLSLMGFTSWLVSDILKAVKFPSFSQSFRLARCSGVAKRMRRSMASLGDGNGQR